MIEIRHLEKKYENATPLKDVNVVINDGDVISIIGPSGTGKSTLLRCINLLERPTNGQIIFDGEEITAAGYPIEKARKKMGMVFQSFNLFNHLTVIENLMIPQMDMLNKSKQEAYDTGVALLKRVGLSGRELQYPAQLSGGQKQRVAIARTLAMDPDVILFDEPTSALDPTMVAEVQAVIRDLSKTGKTMMIVTHEMNFAKNISNRVFYMDQGGIYEDGSPEQVFENPVGEATRQFIRQLKVLKVVVEDSHFDFIGANSTIEQYCIQNDISPRTKYRICLIFEELVLRILSSRLDTYPIEFTVEYTAKDEIARVTVVYHGEQFRIEDSDDELSYQVIKQSVEDINHSYDESTNENKLEITVK